MKGKHIFLRTLEPTDLQFLYKLENDTSGWMVSQTRVPFSKDLLKGYIDSAQDLFNSNQVRFVICINETNIPIGTIDLFEFDSINQRAGVGLIILEDYRKAGLGNEALQLVINYCFTHLLLKNIFCNILVSNNASIKLFTNNGFKLIGTKTNWYRTNSGWEDELLFQLKSDSPI